MALYVHAGTRRRRTALIAGAAVIAGLAVGLLIGRLTAESTDDVVHSIQADARETAAGLRVIALHDEAGALANSTTSDGGTELVLKRTKTQLLDELDRAVWISTDQRDALLLSLNDLTNSPDRTSPEFGKATEDVAAQIESTFGVGN